MIFTVAVAPEPRRCLRKLDRHAQQRFIRKSRELAAEPFLHPKALKGVDGLRSARVGGWRVIYTVDVDAQRLVIAEIAPRGQVYRGL